LVLHAAGGARAAGAAGEEAAAAFEDAEEDGEGDEGADYYAGDGGIFAIVLLHAIIPTRERLRRLLDAVDVRAYIPHEEQYVGCHDFVVYR
jgi:hypothetical protein